MLSSNTLTPGTFVQLRSDPSIHGVVKTCEDRREGIFVVRMCHVTLSKTLVCTCGEHDDIDEMELPQMFWEQVPS